MGAKLIAEEGIARGLILSFEEGERWIIGRDPDECDFIIEDSKVSRRHALIYLSDDGYRLQNLSSTNPIFVNDQEMTEEALLQEGDRIKIGSTLFHFTTQAEVPPLQTPEEIDKMPQEEEPVHYETIFEETEVEPAAPSIDLTPSGKWLLKVLSGPNTGAEIALQSDHVYVLGTDSTVCDIVFYDLSVSRQHAKISVGADDKLVIEDLQSRNGVIVDGKIIEGQYPLENSNVVSLGTTSFIIIDREAVQQTIPAALPSPEEAVEPAIHLVPPTGAEVAAAAEATAKEALPKAKPKPALTGGSFILLFIAMAIIIVTVAGSLSLFKTEEVMVPPRDFNQEIQTAVSSFPDVRFMYNKTTGKLFLLGHVLTGIEKAELLYNLQAMTYITKIDDNVVVDEYVWSEMNQIIEANPDWVGVSMYSPLPGRFILTGYLQTQAQGGALADYIRGNFNYLDRLDNQVVVEELLFAEVITILQATGFFGVNSLLSNGDVTLSGYIPQDQSVRFQEVVDKISRLRGVRNVKNLVIAISAEQSVVDLSSRYTVTGFSKFNDVNINVLINGRILTRGDLLDGMTVISIQNRAIFLEKNGVKYKINYNQ